MIRTVTVRELIAALEREDPDEQIVVSCDYGDICHTEQAIPLRGIIQSMTLERSAYSRSGWAVVDGDEDGFDVLVLG